MHVHVGPLEEMTASPPGTSPPAAHPPGPAGRRLAWAGCGQTARSIGVVRSRDRRPRENRVVSWRKKAPADFFRGQSAVPALLTAILLLAGGCSRLANHPIVPVARDEVARNPRVAELLAGPGGKVECEPAVTGRSSDTDGIATLQFEARGPRGRGTVVVEGKKVGGEWGVTLLEVRPADGGEHLVLTADLEARTGVDTPKFDPTAAARSPAAVPPPPADIEIALPPGAPQ